MQPSEYRQYVHAHLEEFKQRLPYFIQHYADQSNVIKQRYPTREDFHGAFHIELRRIEVARARYSASDLYMLHQVLQSTGLAAALEQITQIALLFATMDGVYETLPLTTSQLERHHRRYEQFLLELFRRVS